MADLTFNTTNGAIIERELEILFLNTAGASATSPVWSPLGSRVPDSNMEYDWQIDSSIDILGVNRTTMKKPTITQSFDPLPLSAGDAAVLKLWNLAVKEHNYSALANLDMLVVHRYAGTSGTAEFAERYAACAVEVSGLGGEGGGEIDMPINVTFGGARTTGTWANSTSTFTPDTTTGSGG